ncbi:MAG TPA: pyridoxal-phosphate dependent enzyme [Chryseolinea sp.]|nr:pyridoxal-phosphate dependent enzyme [Chryseolinea sp.]
MLTYSDTPVQEIQNQIISNAEVRLYIKREDLNHPLVSGNKWWKLKYNLAEAIAQGKDTLLTFGGAYSNHIYATAAAAQEMRLKAVGIIRGEEKHSVNQVIQFARDAGMKLHFVSREFYRQKTEDGFFQKLQQDFGNFYLIPEGGSNDFAVQGVQEFAEQLAGKFDYVCCPVGTGGTLAGLINGFKGSGTIVGISVLKDGSFLNDEVRRFGARYDNWTIQTQYDFGGYAKSTPWLSSFMEDFHKMYGTPIETVYSGKMMAGVFDLLSKGFFERGSSILLIHTGGIH